MESSVINVRSGVPRERNWTSTSNPATPIRATCAQSVARHWSPQAGRTSYDHDIGVSYFGGSSTWCCHTTYRQNQGNKMEALHMLGEVILGSKDVSTVGAVVEVWLSMVIALVIRLRYRKDFFFFL